MSTISRAESILDILASRAIRTHFQPILSARQKSIVGLEALSRGIAGVEAVSVVQAPPAGQLIPPAKLFEMAAEEGVTGQLERLCRETAIRSFAQLAKRPAGLVLFMNLEPSAVVDDCAAATELHRLSCALGVSPRNIAIEILESRVDDFSRLCRLFDRLRAWGFLVVLDDVGAGHSNLNRIPLIRPDILKVDRGLISGIDTDYYKQETFKSLVGLSRRIGALVVAEGVETEAEAMVALELGVDLLQGHFLSRAEPILALDDQALTDATDRTDALAKAFKRHMISKINQRKLHHRRLNIILNQLLCELANTQAERFEELLAQTIVHHPTVECIYVLNDAGVQITNTIGNLNIPRQDTGVMFHPAPKGADHSLKEYCYMLMDVELQKYTTDPYVSLASGNLCRTISTVFRDAGNNRMFILCIDVGGEDAGRESDPGARSA